jgi:hypothetical protein
MLRLVLGFVVTVAGLVMLGRAGVLDWGFPLTMLGMAPLALVGGLLMGLHEEPPPWRRRNGAVH